MKQNKVVYAVIILALIVGAFNLFQRFSIEQENKNVEFIMDDYLLREFKEKNNVKENLLPVFKENGLTGVAIHEESIDDLIDLEGIWFFTGDDIIKNKELTGEINPLFAQFSYDRDSAFLLIQNQPVLKRVQEYFKFWNKEIDSLQYKETDTGALIFFPEWESQYQHLSGIDIDRINQIRENDLKVILRLGNSSINHKRNWSYLDELAPEYVIFSGDEVLGYQSDNIEKNSGTALRHTADIMQKNNIKLGMIEPFLARFRGNNQLAYLLNFNLVRVHSIQKEEMAKYSFDKIVNRYLRAVKERDVRLLYLKPFFEIKTTDHNYQNPVKLNTVYLKTLSEKLLENGFTIGQAKPYPVFSNSPLSLVIIGLGIVAAGLILLEYLAGVSLNKWKWILLLLGLLAEIILLKLGYNILTRQILALTSSIVFPSLAVIIGLLTIKKQIKWLLAFVKVTVISVVGAVLVAASLNHISFLVKVEQFRGVKLAFVLPLLVVSWYFVKNKFSVSLNREKQSNGVGIINLLDEFFNTNIKVKHLLLLLIIGVGGLIYIGRTGNYSLFSVSFLEAKLRVFLEQILYVRPRFKEFLIGHPLLLTALGLHSRFKFSFIFYPLLLVGTIGQINLVNTFAHIHMPLLISILRTINGFWLGLLLGCILVLIVKGVLYYFDKKLSRNRMKTNE